MTILPYLRFVQEGTNYQIGYARGCFLREDEHYRAWIDQSIKDTPPMTDEELSARSSMLKKHCPNLWEELIGFADGYGVAPKDLVYLRMFARPRAGACSQVAVLPEKSANGHLLIARNYEYSLDDEMIFSITRTPGAYRHAGFSIFQAGRSDGMNEKGLCVSMTGCEVVSSPERNEGLFFPAPIRTLLDTCATVEEALHRLAPMPISSHFQLMLADTGGDAAIVEFAHINGEPVRAIRRAENGYLASYNHYQASEIAGILSEKRFFSYARQVAVDTFMAAHEKVSLEDLMMLLEAPVPSGLSCRAYSEFFGTLRSMLFDATDKRLFCSMGFPRAESWFEVNLDEDPCIERIYVPFEDEPAPEMFWHLV